MVFGVCVNLQNDLLESNNTGTIDLDPGPSVCLYDAKYYSLIKFI